MSINVKPSAEQLRILKSNSSNIIVRAKPGSGKTRTALTYAKIKAMKNKQSLFIAFSKQAVEEAKDRIADCKDEIGGLINPMTFHGLCLRIYRQYDGILKLNPQACNRIIWDLIKKHEKSNDSAGLGKISLSYNSIKHEFSNMPFLEKAEQEASPYWEIYRDYIHRQQELGIVDYSALHPLALSILEDKNILAEVQKGYDWIFVDEGHDLNEFNMRLLSRLYKDKFFGVISEEQSIYGFRHARPSYLLQFAIEIDAEIFDLTINFRSGQKIVDLCNDIMQVAEGSSEYIPMKSGKTCGLTTGGKDTSEVEVLEPFENTQQEAEVIASMIESDTDKSFILYRNHYYSADIERELAYKEIPFYIINEKGFFQVDEVKDVLAYITSAYRLAQNNHKSAMEALIPVLNKPFRWFPKNIEEQLNDYYEQKDNLIIALQQFYKGTSKNQTGAINGAAKELSSHLIILSYLSSPLSMIKYIRVNMKYNKYIIKTKFNPDSENDEELLATIDKFEEIIERFENVEDLLKWCERIKPVKESEDAMAILMSSHASKGKEIENVYVIGSHLYPYQPKMKYRSNTDMEEDRRLLYVACSRAKQKTVISTVNNHSIFLEHNIVPSQIETVQNEDKV